MTQNSPNTGFWLKADLCLKNDLEQKILWEKWQKMTKMTKNDKKITKNDKNKRNEKKKKNDNKWQ